MNNTSKNVEFNFSENFKRIPKSFIREILEVADQRNIISFAGGLPNPDFFPVNELQLSAQSVLKEQGEQVLQYAGSQGYYPLREWIAKRYGTKFQSDISPDDVVITGGSQQSIDICSKLFVNPDDTIIVEQPTYLGGIQAMSAYRPRFLPVKLYSDGPDLDQVKEHCWGSHPKLMYSIPNFQNPSGLCYSEEKRKDLANVLEQFSMLLIEDDPYNEIRFEGEDLKPIYCSAPDKVFWTGSFSKMIAPGLRMGWVVLPKGMAKHFVKAKQSTDLHSNNLSQFVIYHYLKNNDVDAHLKIIRNGYKQQCDCMKQMIDKYFPDSIKYTSPQGGMFLWLTLPDDIDSEVLIEQCIEKGVAFVPGQSFFTEGKGNNHIRMNFSNSSLENIEKGIKIMAKAILELKSNLIAF